MPHAFNDQRLTDRSFFDRPSAEVAPRLLNKIFVSGNCAGRIVEVEAYEGQGDMASHAYRKQTKRNEVMFGPPGFMYVYFTYGMHYCLNVVCREEGTASAILIRALEPIMGVEEMRERRPANAHAERALMSGPAKLCQALAINGDHNGVDLLDPDAAIFLADDGMALPAAVSVGPRIGITQGLEHQWRWWNTESKFVSR